MSRGWSRLNTGQGDQKTVETSQVQFIDANKSHLPSRTEDKDNDKCKCTDRDQNRGGSAAAVHRQGHRHPFRGAKAEPNDAIDAEGHR